MDRKEFIVKTSAGFIIGIPVVSLIGCSSSDDSGGDPGPGPGPGPDPDPDPDPQGNCVENGTDTNISANHGHEVMVSKEDVDAAVEKTYNLSEASTDQHIHQITITSAQFASLKSNSEITVSSTSNSGHTHSVNVKCATA